MNTLNIYGRGPAGPQEQPFAPLVHADIHASELRVKMNKF